MQCALGSISARLLRCLSQPCVRMASGVKGASTGSGGKSVAILCGDALHMLAQVWLERDSHHAKDLQGVAVGQLAGAQAVVEAEAD